jgi:hypothetical protein
MICERGGAAGTTRGDGCYCPLKELCCPTGFLATSQTNETLLQGEGQLCSVAPLQSEPQENFFIILSPMVQR